MGIRFAVSCFVMIAALQLKFLKLRQLTHYKCETRELCRSRGSCLTGIDRWHMLTFNVIASSSSAEDETLI
ncbi:hypothetical protein T10_10766 [Trichinella papuae]|uniref:Secreted protein n=1 Tax=Trichinella papuae TaxID=268474 RepID=A0A0V1MAE0_9BILA|nr:hypothetical protein T10_10766 [Trichinella papuae]